MRLPDKDMLVGTTLQPPHPPLYVIQQKSSTSEHTAKLTATDSFIPPDLLHVMYKETYDEFVGERSPVVLASHCWTAQQTLYVGCAGGQLLLADFETSTIKVMANPQVS